MSFSEQAESAFTSLDPQELDGAPPVAARRDRGERVLAPKTRGWLYPGTVNDRNGEQCYVEFDDGGEGWFAAVDCFALNIDVGSRVYCRWKNGDIYYRGTVKERRDDEIYIHYDDGDREWNVIDRVRIPVNAQAEFFGGVVNVMFSNYGCFSWLLLAGVIAGVYFLARLL